MVKSIEAPDRATQWSSVCNTLAVIPVEHGSPGQFHLCQKISRFDVQYYKTHTVGTGTFKLKNYTRGLYHRAGAQSRLLEKGALYLDGIKYFIITDTSARAKALRSGRVDIELRKPTSGGCGWHHIGAAGR